MTEVTREVFQNGLGAGMIVTYRAPRGPLRPRGIVPEGSLDQKLELVGGIGPKIKQRLLDEGISTIAELAQHPRYGRSASRIFAAIAGRDVPALLRAGAKDVELAQLFDRGEHTVIDIESVGLWQVLPLFLIGVGRPTPSGWSIRQYFARSFEEEGAILHQAVSEIAGRKVCITYNGKAFDEPFVRARLGLHGVRPLKFALHVDFLHSCRRACGDVLPNCKLSTVARHMFGMERGDDIPGSEVPDRYFEFVRHGDPSAIEPILRHNALDVLSLCHLVDAEGMGRLDDRSNERKGVG